MTLLLIGLAASTLLSEDAACLAAGVLVRQQHVPAWAGVGACAVGIYLGDALLWWAGRALRRLERSTPARAFTKLARLVPRRQALESAVDSPAAILASRFIPGSRLPLYVAAGACGQRPRRFFLWTFIAVLVWAPLIVLGTASSLLGGLALLGMARLSSRISWRRLWIRTSARLDRWRRWEFWPSAILYAPVAAHLLRLAMRHGGLGTMSAANPGIPEGGFVGESKSAILARLAGPGTLVSVRIDEGGTEARLADVRQLIEAGDFELPIVLKPDAGQRGVGVRLVRSLDEARSYFAQQPGPAVMQPYHPGPYEAGVFYYRRPGEARGRIFSITDKRFPVIVGDGHSTLEDLIWHHPRYRLQAHVFLARYAALREYVVPAGEPFGLGMAGNHAQGALFLDGAHLWTPALEARIDEIARRMPGFYIGRFDIRYADPDAFRRGEDLAVVELNGVTSESTNIYDPSSSLWKAWGVLCRQWTLVFEIGAANRARGCTPATARRLLHLALEHLRATPPVPLAS